MNVYIPKQDYSNNLVAQCKFDETRGNIRRRETVYF